MRSKVQILTRQYDYSTLQSLIKSPSWKILATGLELANMPYIKQKGGIYFFKSVFCQMSIVYIHKQIFFKTLPYTYLHCKLLTPKVHCKLHILHLLFMTIL